MEDSCVDFSDLHCNYNQQPQLGPIRHQKHVTNLHSSNKHATNTNTKNKKLFPKKLWDLINDHKYNFCLRWSDDGQLVYLNRDDFEDSYLKTPENQFHTQKAISFVRQMNMYGFRKVDDCYYENDNFKRDCEHLLKNMIRKHPNKNSDNNAKANCISGNLGPDENQNSELSSFLLRDDTALMLQQSSPTITASSDSLMVQTSTHSNYLDCRQHRNYPLQSNSASPTSEFECQACRSCETERQMISSTSGHRSKIGKQQKSTAQARPYDRSPRRSHQATHLRSDMNNRLTGLRERVPASPQLSLETLQALDAVAALATATTGSHRAQITPLLAWLLMAAAGFQG